MTDPALTPVKLAMPDVRLFGAVDDSLFRSCMQQFDGLTPREDPVVVQLTTLGGAADTGRRLSREIGLRRQALGRRIVFVGVETVYSAGVTFMAGFPREDRFLSARCSLLIHERQMDSNVHFVGPLSAVRLSALAKLREIDEGVALQNEGFRALIDGSDIGFDEICAMARDTTYLTAQTAVDRGLVAGLI